MWINIFFLKMKNHAMDWIGKNNNLWYMFHSIYSYNTIWYTSSPPFLQIVSPSLPPDSSPALLHQFHCFVFQHYRHSSFPHLLSVSSSPPTFVVISFPISSTPTTTTSTLMLIVLPHTLHDFSLSLLQQLYLWILHCKCTICFLF